MNKLSRFPNLMPNATDLQFCTALMTRIDDLAPDGSNNRAVISRTEDGSYCTIIAVNAIGGQFTSEGVTNSLASSLKKAHKGMLSLLREWKELRFK